MVSPFRRFCGDALVSAGVLATVLGVLVSVDQRVREQLQAVVRAQSPEFTSGAQARLSEIGYVVFDAARTQSIDHAPLMIFVVCATVLLLAMVRT